MKKILPIFISSLFLLCFWSCSEKGFGDGNCQVTINATIEDLEIDVKSCPTGQYKLYVGIFQNGTQLADPLQFDFDNGQANAVISLVADQTYDLVFWAQGATAAYYIENLSAITIPTDNQPTLTLSASKQYDAFCAVLKGVNFSGSITQEVTLDRVGGVLNILHSGSGVLSGGEIDSTIVEYKSYTKFNPLAESETNKFSDEKELKQTIIFPSLGDFVEKETINGTECTVLARSYFFTPEKKFREVIITTKNDNTKKETTLTSVPFEQNKKTNLIGDFI